MAHKTRLTMAFQSTLPRGSDAVAAAHLQAAQISIHAPSRERQIIQSPFRLIFLFQSTLPRGSDIAFKISKAAADYFNPRSLAGATTNSFFTLFSSRHFNPRSLAGATVTISYF